MSILYLLLGSGQWQPGWNHFFMCGQDIKHSVLGFIGIGRIAQSIMKRLKAFEPKLMLYTSRKHDVEAENVFGVVYNSLEELLAKSDIILVCCSLNNSTRHLLGHEQFKLMKSNAIVINTSRGAVIDQKALLEALTTRRIWTAGLDVMEVEPLPADDPLRALDNVGKSCSIIYSTYFEVAAVSVGETPAEWEEGRHIRVIIFNCLSI